MSWKTSKGFVSSAERIAKLENKGLIYGSTTSGAVARYKTKKDGSKLAALTEGGYAVDIFLKKDEKNKRFIIDDNAVDNGQNQFHSSVESMLLGILGSGQGSGLNLALDKLDNKDKVIFWYNGTWNIIEKHMQGNVIFIPQELAVRVATQGGLTANKVLAALKPIKFENSKFESVSVQELTNLLNMQDLYSQWEFDNIVNIMMNTDMKNGPYKLKRIGRNITIKFSVNFINGNKNTSGVTVKTIHGIDKNTENATFSSYVEVIKTAFEKWSVSHEESDAANFGGSGISVLVKIIENEFPKSAEVKIVNTMSTDADSEGRSFVTGGDSWKINNVGEMTLFNYEGSSDISKMLYMQVACHEFGHFLGLGNAYDGANETSEVSINDIMWLGEDVSPNDIEMLFLAALKNQKQFFYSSGGQRISDAITK